jgi:hypothetical protein
MRGVPLASDLAVSDVDLDTVVTGLLLRVEASLGNERSDKP